ncbi:MAG TPA: TonB-dependent receptor plug domain-containing protein, partial [Pseudomonadaceae bacterium]|nr:TonB-dependent receptor plug domain-containing protein [Pseudomonadaceae bacterium]
MMASAMGLLTLPAAPVLAQQGMMALEEIIVTARRREERLQDVPVSMTVLNQQQMDNANIFNAADLATYTPSLQANNRFGSDATNFAIRGFSQELRTTASVGVYFAEVVAPRGANTVQSGDGAGPGDFFDLENVQVLKGPQGTLFGRNTTGGAVLLSPKKPTDEFEGYAEVSIGNYDMKRAQGVINIPVSDNFRMRFGVDQQTRDGYLKNISGIGPKDFADTDYLSLRGSFVWDITDSLENYTIVKYSESQNNGAPYSLFACNMAPDPNTGEEPGLGAFCA